MKYELVPLNSEEIKEKYPEYYDDYDGAFFSALVLRDSFGDIIKLIACDGGEPEDQTFSRDWSWVETELNRALDNGLQQAGETVSIESEWWNGYDAGKEDGVVQGYDEGYMDGYHAGLSDGSEDV